MTTLAQELFYLHVCRRWRAAMIECLAEGHRVVVLP
jgi:hypothetical protein